MSQALLPMAGASHPTQGMTRIELDAYYTDLSLARRCVSLLPIERHDLVMEPHVGGGSFAQALIERTDARIHVRDINPHAPGLSKNVDARTVGCFLSWRPDANPVYGTPTDAQRPEWIAGNPPYGEDLMPHVSHALRVSRRHVAMLVRLAIFAHNGPPQHFVPSWDWKRSMEATEQLTLELPS